MVQLLHPYTTTRKTIALTFVSRVMSSGQGYGFSSGHVWMWAWDCEESWALKNWCFWTVVLEMWCWRRLLRVPWTARRSNQSILKEISPGCSLERVMLKLKLQYFGHLMRRVDSLEKTLMLGGIGGRRRGWQRMRWLDDITDSMAWVWVNSGSWWWTGRPGVLWFTGSQSRTWLSNWSELNWMTNDAEHLCVCILAICIQKTVISSSLSTFQLGCLCCRVVRVLYMFWIIDPYQMYDL